MQASGAAGASTGACPKAGFVVLLGPGGTRAHKQCSMTFENNRDLAQVAEMPAAETASPSLASWQAPAAVGSLPLFRPAFLRGMALRQLYVHHKVPIAPCKTAFFATGAQSWETVQGTQTTGGESCHYVSYYTY